MCLQFVKDRLTNKKSIQKAFVKIVYNYEQKTWLISIKPLKYYMRNKIILFVKIILGEKDKVNKIKMVLRGYKDYKKGIKGKLK